MSSFKYFPTHLKKGDHQLIIPCEIGVKSVIPAIKSIMAREMVETQGLKQTQVAKILGISQSAVSKYTLQVRGHIISIDDIEEIRPLINKMINLLLNGTYQRAELLKFFCKTCIIIRKKSLMCQFCRKTDPKIKIEECGFCLG